MENGEQTSQEAKATDSEREMEQYAREGEAAAESDRQIQEKAGKRRERRQQEQQQKEPKDEQQQAVQPPDQKQPTPPLPEQHLAKPGDEKDLRPRPQYKAPTYKGSDKLAGMTALITGADSGIGRAVAVLYAREGADVAVVYLNEHEDAEETRAAVEEEGQEAILIPGDVTNPQFCRDAVEKTIDAFGRLDILVNNAAFQQHNLTIEDLSEEQFDRTMKTNLYGYFYMVKAAIPHLPEGGAILNSGSITGLRGQKSLPDYSTTKGGIHAFTKSLAQNLVDRGIRVNAVAPGPVWTPLNPADKPAEEVSEFGANKPMKRPAQPEEISPAYVYLAAPSCSSYMTGVVLPITGGETH